MDSDSYSSNDVVIIGDKEYLTSEGLCRRLEISQRTLSRWIYHHKGPPTIQVGRKRLHETVGVNDWLTKLGNQQNEPLPLPRRRPRQRHYKSPSLEALRKKIPSEGRD